MSTRARLAIVTIGPGGRERYRSAYLHNGGGPGGYTARTLADHYADRRKAAQLIAMGDCSSLGPELGGRHDFDDMAAREAQCTFYGRDRGEAAEVVAPADHGSFAATCKAAAESDAEFLYLFAPIGAGPDWAWHWLADPRPRSRRSSLRPLHAAAPAGVGVAR